MSRRKTEVTCNYHYHYMMPIEMAPMGMMYGTGQMSGMPDMYGSEYPMPDYMYGSHQGGNPDGFTGGLFFGAPFFPPFFTGRRFFPFFFPFLFFPFF